MNDKKPDTQFVGTVHKILLDDSVRAGVRASAIATDDTQRQFNQGDQISVSTLNKTATEIKVGSTETLSVTAVAAGTVTIYAEANNGSGVKGNCTVTVTPATKTLTLTGQYFDRSIGSFVTKSLEIEYTDNDTWKVIAERYDEVSLENNSYGPSESKVVMFWTDMSQHIIGCELKSNESTYNYNLVSINDKVSAYSSYYLDE